MTASSRAGLVEGTPESACDVRCVAMLRGDIGMRGLHVDRVGGGLCNGRRAGGRGRGSGGLVQEHSSFRFFPGRSPTRMVVCLLRSAANRPLPCASSTGDRPRVQIGVGARTRADRAVERDPLCIPHFSSPRPSSHHGAQARSARADMQWCALS